jgi:transcriptional regulator with XRE-family HTH domain
MSFKFAIPFDLMADKSARPTAVRPPASYGRYLEQIMERLLAEHGIGREAFAKRAKIDPNTLRRNLIGAAERSVKGMNTIRDALIALGADDVLPVPTTEDWQPPAPPLPEAADRVRRNLTRFRSTLMIDTYALAQLAHVALNRLNAVEAGRDQLTMDELAAVAAALGASPGAFFEDPSAPAPELRPPRRWWLGGPDTEDLGEEANAEIARIVESAKRARDKQRRK